MAIMANWKTEEKIFKRTHVIMVVLFVLISFYIVSLNDENQILIALGCLLYLALSSFRHLYLSARRHTFWHWVLPYLEGGIIYAVTFYDINNNALSLIVLIAWDIALDYKYTYGIVYTIVGYVAYMSFYIAGALHLPLANIILLLFIGAIQFTLFVGFAFLAKGYSIQSKNLRATTAQLHAKMIALEEMTTLKERNGIAVEIHNTVGHQLTTALVQIEAAQMILEKDPEEGKRRLAIIKEQVRMGLNEIRKTVHAIKLEEEYEDFAAKVDHLLDSVRTQAKIVVEFNMDDISETKLEVKKTLYHLVLESITNAIKHGHCRKMRIKLTKEEGIITLSSFNDGVVPTNINYGYGLHQMKESLHELGGTLVLKIDDHGWFGLEAKLPIYYRREGKGPNGED